MAKQASSWPAPKPYQNPTKIHLGRRGKKRAPPPAANSSIAPDGSEAGITLLVIPHARSKVARFRLSRLSLAMLFFVPGIILAAFIFFGIRFLDINNLLHSRSNNKAALAADLASLNTQVSELAATTRRFDSVLTRSFDNLNVDSTSTANLAHLANASPDMDTATQLDQLRQYFATASAHVKALALYVSSNRNIIKDVPCIWPIEGGVGTIVEPWGEAIDPLSGHWTIRDGISISTFHVGNRVLATAQGTVIDTGFSSKDGIYIRIQHKHGFSTFYGNLMAALVARGDEVTQGQHIGIAGMTGHDIASGLLYKIQLGTGTIDPDKLLNIRDSRAQFEQSIAAGG